MLLCTKHVKFSMRESDVDGELARDNVVSEYPLLMPERIGADIDLGRVRFL